ncbi:hypothetical protein GJ496_004413 [Pomphorhynchus laevis]|nr:hypothetical protein GJ496_004413 [Pomphorhynchus laevis]
MFTSIIFFLLLLFFPNCITLGIADFGNSHVISVHKDNNGIYAKNSICGNTYMKNSDSTINLTKNFLRVTSSVFSNSRISNIYLSWNYLRKIHATEFANSPRLIVLLLDHNQIAIFESGAIDNDPVLAVIDLSYNKLTRIYKNTFLNLTSLIEVRLELNDISVIEPDAFKGTVRLQLLDLNSNSLVHLPADIAIDTKNLFVLILSNNLFVSIPELFNSTNITKLDLSFNSITELVSSSILLPKIDTLILNNNMIERVVVDVSNNLPIKIVQLLNTLSSLNNLQCILNLFKNSVKISISVHNLEYYLDTGSIEQNCLAVEENFILEELSVTYSKLVRVYKIRFEKLKALRKLDLSNNEILHWHTNFLTTCPTLRKLNISGNNITSLTADNLKAGYFDLDEFSFTTNHGTLLGVDYMNQHAKFVGLTDISTIRLQPFSTILIENSKFKENRRISLSYSRLRKIFIEHCMGLNLNNIIFSRSLETLHLRNDSLTDFKFNVEWSNDSIQLNDLDLSSNRLSEFNCSANLNNLEYLTLDKNFIESFVCEHLTKLKHISITNNRLKEIEIYYLEQLENINLKHNELTKFDYRYGHHLKFINLDHNNIRNCEKIMITAHSNVLIESLSHNPISSCEGAMLATNIIAMRFHQIIRIVSFRLVIIEYSRANNAWTHRDHIIAFFNYKDPHTVTELDLSFGILEFIDTNAFDTLKKLHSVYLNGNRLRTLSPELFKESSLLQIMDLSRNRISNFSDLLGHNISFKVLNLSHNRIESIKFTKQILIETIDLSFNQISIVVANLVPSSLKTLNIANNSIQSLELCNFQNINMDISNNNITQNMLLTVDTLRLLSERSLSTNPIRDIRIFFEETCDHQPISNVPVNRKTLFIKECSNIKIYACKIL